MLKHFVPENGDSVPSIFQTNDPYAMNYVVFSLLKVSVWTIILLLLFFINTSYMLLALGSLHKCFRILVFIFLYLVG